MGLRAAGSMVALPWANSCVELRRREAGDLVEVAGAREVAAVHAVGIGPATVEGDGRLEVGVQPALDVGVDVHGLDVEGDARLGQLRLDVLRLVDRSGVLALARRWCLMVRPSALAGLSARYALALARSRVGQGRALGSLRYAGDVMGPVIAPSPRAAVSSTCWRSMAHEMARRTLRSSRGALARVQLQHVVRQLRRRA